MTDILQELQLLRAGRHIRAVEDIARDAITEIGNLRYRVLRAQSALGSPVGPTTSRVEMPEAPPAKKHVEYPYVAGANSTLCEAPLNAAGRKALGLEPEPESTGYRLDVDAFCTALSDLMTAGIANPTWGEIDEAIAKVRRTK